MEFASHQNAHPYMANSTAAAKKIMMDVIGIKDVEELFEQIPSDNRFPGEFHLDEPLESEVQLHRHMSDLLHRNSSCSENLNFLGAGVWQHYVPAVVDVIVSRSEFLTPVWGTSSSDQGRTQVWFEFQSQLGALLDMDFVGLPVYSYGAAAGYAIKMAARMTGRNQVLIPASLDPERRAVIQTYCGAEELNGYIDIVEVAFMPQTGQLDLNDLDKKMSNKVAAVYFENPGYLGQFESQSAEIARIARAQDAETIVGVDPLSLGAIAPPSSYGADIVVGTIQTLGVHMNAGGGVAGFIATRDEERYALQYPTLQVSVTDTVVPGERAFGLTLFSQSSYGSREHGNDWTGNGVYLWAIASSVYMALLGPTGFREIGMDILRRSHYAAKRIASIPGLTVNWPAGFFKEFVVNFDGVTVELEEIDKRLLENGIFGGKILTNDFPQLGKAALYCVTEIHTQSDIDRLVSTLERVTK